MQDAMYKTEIHIFKCEATKVPLRSATLIFDTEIPECLLSELPIVVRTPMAGE